jgi:diguanylate cyclase (GGDEF)-like protein
MVDIDHFKKINDNHGHAAGDLVLAQAARRIAGAVRISDTVGRYGGEEFCVLLPGFDEQQAADVASRLVDEAARQSIRLANGATVRYTLSAGYAVGNSQPLADGPGEALVDVIERADQALYRAKHQGRNRALAADAAAAPGGRPRSA